MYIFLIIILISIIVLITALLLSKKRILDREKNSAFECGFDTSRNFRIPFSLHFYLIAIIFLIFDIEITLFLPFIISIKITKINIYMLTITILIRILLIGLYHEWNQGCLRWNF